MMGTRTGTAMSTGMTTAMSTGMNMTTRRGIGMAEQLGANSGALVRLLWLVSPALPIGSYAYSRGLEHAVQEGTVHDDASAEDWIGGVLENQVATLDLPLLVRLHD